MNLPELDELIPHRDCMRLLDRVTTVGPGRASAELTITPESSFYAPGFGVPAYIAIEYMAQTMAAVGGYEAWSEGRAAPVGYLLGTRRFRSNVGWLPVGARLEVRVEEEFADDAGMGVYSCRLTGPGIECYCRLNVYRPEQEHLT